MPLIRKIIKKIRKIQSFFAEIARYNKKHPACRINKIYYCENDQTMLFKIEIPGCYHDIKLPAKEIARNPALLSRFSPLDQDKIIINSGLCCYRINDSTYSDEFEQPIYTVQAEFNGEKRVKKFTAKELYTNKPLFEKLSSKEQNFILSAIANETVLPFYKK